MSILVKIGRKLYMEAICKSKPIWMVLGTYKQNAKLIQCVKFGEYRFINDVTVALLVKIGKKLYMGAISKSEPIWLKLVT